MATPALVSPVDHSLMPHQHICISDREIQARISSISAEEIDSLARVIAKRVCEWEERKGRFDRNPYCFDIRKEISTLFSSPEKFFTEGGELNLYGERSFKIDLEETRKSGELWFSLSSSDRIIQIPPTALYISPLEIPLTSEALDVSSQLANHIDSETDIKRGGQYLVQCAEGTFGLERLEVAILALGKIAPQITYNPKQRMCTLCNSSKIEIDTVKKALDGAGRYHVRHPDATIPAVRHPKFQISQKPGENIQLKLT